MGLDIYLYRYEDRAKIEHDEAEYERRSAEIWKEDDGRRYEDIPDAEKETARAAVAEMAREIGLGEWGESPLKQKVELPSATYPDHLFKIGYLRSSYNSGGTNHVLRNALDKDLYWVFGYEGNAEPDNEAPDWQASRDRALALRDEWTAYIAKNPYRVLRADLFFANDPRVLAHDEQSALQVFLTERDRQGAAPRHPAFESYSNLSGHFFFGADPLRVRGIVTGTERGLLGGVGQPCTYVIYEDNQLDWYTHALEITAEMCEWVLAQSDPEKYVLHWSG